MNVDAETLLACGGSAHGRLVPHFELAMVLDGHIDENEPGFAALLAGYEPPRTPTPRCGPNSQRCAC